MNKLMDTKAAAPCVGVEPGTLENWRVRGTGPKFIKTPGLRGKVLYDPADLEEWKSANRFQSTSEITAREKAGVAPTGVRGDTEAERRDHSRIGKSKGSDS